MNLALLISVSLHLLSPAGNPSLLHADDAPFNTLQKIDAAFSSGEIDQARRQYLRVAAIKAPQLLPQYFSINRDVPTRPSGTTALVEAWQWASKAGDRGAEVRRLLGPPPDLPYVIHSETLPLRVSFDSPGLAAMAQHVLEASEISWQVETEDYGFMVPRIEAGEDSYSIRLENIRGTAGAYTSPYAHDYSVDWSACYTYIVYNTQNSDDKVDTTMAHELNHAMQAAMDCSEVTTFWENSATYIMGNVFPNDWDQSTQMFPFFQNQPWRPLSYMNQQNSDLYEYGGALWLYYLAERFAPDDGPVMLRQIWQASMQNSGLDNEPDYFDAMTNVLVDGDADRFDDVFADFSESRYFVGRNDDGRHMPDARDFDRAEVYQVARHTVWALPIINNSPSESVWPQSYGSNHVVLDIPDNFRTPLKISFFADNSSRWKARILSLFDDDTVSQKMALDPDLGGSLIVDTQNVNKLILVVSNIGDGFFDPDHSSGPGVYYRYSIVPAAAEMTAVTPQQIHRGEEVQLHIKGSGFAEFPGMQIKFDVPGIQVRTPISLQDDEVIVAVYVPTDYPLGLHDMTYLQPGSESTELMHAIEVLEKKPEAPANEEPQQGCSCQSTQKLNGAWMLLALLGLALRRKKN